MRMVEVKQVSKSFGARNNLVRALNNISFTIDRGEFVGVMGPSGAGKTTLLNIMSTIDHPSVGRVYLAGQEITALPERDLATFRRENIGFIFQDFNLLPALSVSENLIMVLSMLKIPREEVQKRLAYYSEHLNLKQLLNRYPNELSIGQKQRVAAARALMTQPKILFADEPTGSLDSKSATELLQYLATINLENETTIMMVTHDAFTASYCNRIVFIKDGAFYSEVVRSGSRQQFFNQIIDMQAAIGGGKISDFRNRD
ncbi:ABC transporter ATP-binding protein [Lapidilactobacillus gannanensis]|uniref:ABC transporter ATP-binding protein n=1 Tax=Lapidilactobacillus gannanensis TaxID=2486002 RepID=A0ABW4BPH6_9LACO|nr:ABC transporter ATP-binding protein [Lapidilactobacillus gannanensis]MCH4056663.1 ABC transporter ATP-binding protein [Lactobacillaceae bacterium]